MSNFYAMDGQFWRKFRWPALLLIGLAAMAAGLWLYQSVLAPARSSAAALATLQSRSFSDLAGSDRTLLDWQGKVRVVNFWATWCEPCREEIPALQRVQAKFAANGLETIGISIDHADKVRQFAKNMAITYPLLLGDASVIDVARALGNRAGGLPYTLVIDAQGKLLASKLGGITEAQLTEILLPALGQPRLGQPGLAQPGS
jgi:thiol-disulfide isomerase/thioredoxin